MCWKLQYIINDLTSKVCVPRQFKRACFWNMITGINESRTVTEHISGKCKCNFNSKRCNLN